MGQPDYYPFVMSRAVVRKLHFIHLVVTNAQRSAWTAASRRSRRAAGSAPTGRLSDLLPRTGRLGMTHRCGMPPVRRFSALPARAAGSFAYAGLLSEAAR
jgi:hypothetical protein